MDVEKICRTCLGLTGPLLSIYDGSTDKGGCIADMLQDFTKTKPRRTDKLPEKVCLSCISEINRCYSFKLKCENSSRTLRQLLPDALPEEADEETLKKGTHVEQADKSVQTISEKARHCRAVHTQTVCESKPARANQYVQTVGDTVPNTVDKTTSPLAFKAVAKRDEIVHMRTKLKFEKSSEPQPQIVEYQTRALRPLTTIKRRRIDCPDAEDLPDGSEIIVELQSDENGVITSDNAADADAGSTVYAAVRAEQVGINDTTYYELSSTQFEYDVHEANEPTKHDGGGNMVSYVDDEGCPEDQEAEEYTQIIYAEDGDAEGASQQQTNYNFTIYNNENGEAEIVAKRLTASSAVNTTKSNATGTKKELKCTECIMTFVSSKNLKRHMLKRHGHSEATTDSEMEQNWPALDAVKIEANSNVTRAVKVLAATEESPVSVVNEASEAISPQPIVTPTTPAQLSFFCDRCHAGFALQKSLSYHRNLNACTAPSYSCEECDRVFVSAKTLAEHKNTHLLGNACSECNKVFETNDGLSQHLIAEHKRKRRNQCGVCKKVFTMLSALKDHMRVHNGEKPYLCPMCGKSFSQNANLKQHVMRHSKEKKYKCDECTNSYVTKAELFSHKRTHTGDQPFKCEYCEATFTASCSLVKHKRKHTGERPYACDICPMRFTALNVLKNHRRTHTGEKPYKCFYCNKGFTQKGDCLIHQRTHSERKFACFCGEKFPTLANLRTHMKTHKQDAANANKQCQLSVEETNAVGADASTDSADDNVQSVHITIVDVDDEEPVEDSSLTTVAEETPSGQLTTANRDGSEELLHMSMDQM